MSQYQPFRKTFEIPVIGTDVYHAFFPAEELLGRRTGFSGNVRGYAVRIGEAGTAVVTDIDLYLIDARDEHVDVDNLEADPADYPHDVQVVADIGTDVTGLESDVTAAIREDLVDPEWFSAGLLIALNVTCSASGTATTIFVTINGEIAVP